MDLRILPTLYYQQNLLLLRSPLAFPFSHFLFLSTTGSSLLLHFLILISVLSLISTIGFEEPGVIAMLMLTSCLSWHSKLSYCLDDEVETSLTFFDDFTIMFVPFSFLRSSPGLTWIPQSSLLRVTSLSSRREPNCSLGSRPSSLFHLSPGISSIPPSTLPR